MKFISLAFTLFLFSFHFEVQAQVIEGALLKEVQSESENNVKNESSTLLVNPEILEKLKSPQKTMQTFLEAMNKYKQDSHLSLSNLGQAALVFNLSEFDEGVKKIAGKLAAEKLSGIIDRTANVDLSKIPDHHTGGPWIFIQEQLTYNGTLRNFEVVIAQDPDGAWRFTPETVLNLNDYYQAIYNRPIKEGVLENKNVYYKLKNFIGSFGQDKIFFFTAAQWLGFILVMFFSFLIAGLCKYLMIWYLSRLSIKKEFEFSQAQIRKFSIPFAFLTLSASWLIGINFIDFELLHYTRIARFFYILASITAVWSAFTVVDLFAFHFQRLAAKTTSKFDDTLVPMLSKTAKFLVIAFGTILIAHALTFNVRGLLAGLGLGGIAVALAAKDTIANLFGSVTVILDRPFQIGDYVYLNNSIEGKVEDLGFRSTRIRTPEESLVSIPNSVLANMAIDNYGERKKRRFRVNLEIDLATEFEDIQAFCDDLKKYVKENELLNRNSRHIFINQITNKVIVVQITIYISTANVDVEYQERHKLFSEILHLGKKHKVSLANSSSTLFLENGQNLTNPLPGENALPQTPTQE